VVAWRWRWRGLGIYRLLICASVLHAGKAATIAIIAIEPFLFREFLDPLGFRERGRPQIFHDGPGCRTLAHCMELDDLAAARAVAAPHMATLKSSLQFKDIEVACGDQATSAALA
jgi:hypothetical protein